MRYTLVLNNNYIPVSIMDSKKAFVNVFSDDVVLVSNYMNGRFKSPHAEWEIPSVVRTKTYVKLPYQRATLTKENVHKRDGYTCVYCGEDARRNLTVDHVVPKSRGGKNSWTNLVTSCFSCNNMKDNKTPEEMGWEPPNPQHPHYLVLMSTFVKNIPDEWKDYLFN